MRRNEVFDPGNSAHPHVAAGAELWDQFCIVEGEFTELTLAHAVPAAKPFNVFDQAVHEHCMGEMSPSVKCYRGIFRESHSGRIPCDISPMTVITAIRDAIEVAMAEKGFSRRSLSKAAELSESAVRDLLTRTDNPGIGTLRRIAEALEIPIDQLTGAALMVPVLGKVGAGGEVIFSIDPDNELDCSDLPMVPRPPLVVGRLMALSVQGSSMLPKYEDGDIIYVRRDHDGVLPKYLNRYCAVRTSDGGTYLKILAPGSQAGRYTLRSLNAPDMENVEVEWASLVMFVKPKDGE